MAAICELADLRGWMTYHTYDSRRSTPGFPDLVAVRGSRLVFAELKAAKGRLRSAQRWWLDQLAQVPGVQVHVWYPADWFNGQIDRVLT